jgi:hypothetical protein
MSETPVLHRSFALKIWIFSIVVHALLLWALSLIIIPPAEKPPASAVIQTYSYTEIRLNPIPAVRVEQQPVVQNTTAEPVIPPPQKRPPNKTKASETKAVSRTTGSSSAPEATTNAEIAETKPSKAAGSLSLAQRALASAAAAASEPIADRQQQRDIVFKSSTPVDSELVPALLKSVKTYADGSVLVKGANGCWKVPPAESREGATWLMTSTPCETDTTVEQINDILQKRRTYAND